MTFKPTPTKALLQQLSAPDPNRFSRSNSSNSCDSSLNDLISKIKKFEYLDKQLKLDLPSFLKPHCKIANFNMDQGKISLVVSSSSMAAKWHYLKANLLEKLRSNPVFAGVSQIDIKIDPSVFITNNLKNDTENNLNNKNKSKKFSQESSEVLKQTIQACQDEKIRKQLEKLLKYTC